MSMTTILLAALLLQTPPVKATIQRNEKGDYPKAISLCKEAVAQIDKSPQDAIDLLDKVLNELKIKKIECLIRIEERPAEYTDWYEFYPYHYRGRARTSLAKANAERLDKAEVLMNGAVEDFTKSSDLGYEKSKDLLVAAKAELERVRSLKANPAEDPVAVFRTKTWNRLIADNRYRTAIAKIAEAVALTEPQRADLRSKTEKECAALVLDATITFRDRLASMRGREDSLLSMGQTEFSRYDLPVKEEIVGDHPALDWAYAQHGAITKSRQAKQFALRALLDAAVAASRVPTETTENPWLRASEQLALAATRSVVQGAVDKAQAAAASELRVLRADADAALGDFKGFAAKLDASTQRGNTYVAADAEELEKVMSGFPQDISELANVDVEGCLVTDDPAAALVALLGRLETLRARKAVTRESRIRLNVSILFATALRDLLGGKTEEETASALKGIGAELKTDNAAVDGKRYGPRVERIVAAATK